MSVQAIAPCTNAQHYYVRGKDKVWRCHCGASFTNQPKAKTHG